MIKYGVIGTNWITDEFIKGAGETKGLLLNAVYSRDIKKAKDFAAKYKVEYTFNDLDQMAKSSEIDAVYIANPNSLHFKTAKIFIENKKHVFVEKPIVSNRKEMEELSYIAKKNKVVLMEGIRNMYTPNMKSIIDNLYKLGKIRRYVGVFCQYSSKYDSFKKGESPNIFNPEFSTVSLMDIGVYPVHPMVKMFGIPNSLEAKATKLSSGVDGMGIISFDYGDMDALVIHSKITNSFLKSEIQGEDGVMVIDKISDPKQIEIIYKDGKKENISKETSHYNMYYEALEFKYLIEKGELESHIISHRDSKDVLKVLDMIREQVGVSFPSDGIDFS